ncbi:alpha/beta hydrolase [Herbiconiux sp. CPCC 205763]|uniref:Alpha/beta hydrolase n=1 Tax=Herbiconiux aconitum TaxID=2970913 RepID=A0ABT2GNA4_9MICO|nr:alpha/beta hydrolase [Herbiconiux aconitum]MCS5717621.1 alpha/beta hydrolase [Herbiconiux aconitum]
MSRTDRTWVLIHGVPLTDAVWEPIVPALGPQPAIAPDCTAIPVGADPQAQLAEAIAQRVGGNIDVVGHSFGGQIAVELALLASERVRSLTIVCSRDTPFPAFKAVAEAIRVGQPPSAQATVDRWFTRSDRERGEALIGLVLEEVSAASYPDWSRALDAIAVYDAASRVSSLHMPVTLIGGGLDGVATPGSMRAFRDRLIDGVSITRDDWSHMSPFAHPGLLARMLVAARDRGTMTDSS